jgi:hypothetical protein
MQISDALLVLRVRTGIREFLISGGNYARPLPPQRGQALPVEPNT